MLTHPDGKWTIPRLPANVNTVPKAQWGKCLSGLNFYNPVMSHVKNKLVKKKMHFK